MRLDRKQVLSTGFLSANGRNVAAGVHLRCRYRNAPCGQLSIQAQSLVANA
jgi:hypothetical protein